MEFKLVFPLLLMLPGASFAQTAELVARPDLSEGVMAYPRLAPATPFANTINAALARIDKAQGGDECTTSGGPPYTRSIEVTAQGPRFVSFVVSEEWMCGAHPEEQRSAFVYDLTTGKPVDWTKMLPPRVAGRASVSKGLIKVGTLSSAVLRQAYIAGQDPSADCKPIYDDTEFHFLLWPDARKHELVIDQNDLPHVAAACGGPIALSLAKLKALGVGKPLLDALIAAKPTKLARYGAKR